MACIGPCPTGSIDNWRVVKDALFTLDEQFEWLELPPQEELGEPATRMAPTTTIEALEDPVAALLAEAHQGAGGRSKAPRVGIEADGQSLSDLSNPLEATVQGNYRLTAENSRFRCPPHYP